ncbi:transcriptional regulator NrdR family protein [Mycoplana sp. BE70]|uniref:NrdR family transcriptional regulator n=1 Tax=Mycoplana sp. BE70 TaxID=2817775 RepID=UPI0028552918|nr:transcriptional regulator NrdR family protein [Mycoplana sp. BE70]
MSERANGTIWRLAGILCPQCGTNSSRVLDSRERPGAVRRRRECMRCGGRWSTEERMTSFKAGRAKK